MMLIDVHAHVDYLEDIGSAIRNAKENNVKVIISNGINPEKNRLTLELAEKYDIVKAALGIYPIEARNLTEQQIEEEINFIKKNKSKVVAVGEVGIDYKHGKDIEKEQKQMFEKFISLSEKIKKPIIVHSRQAEEDAVEMLESSDSVPVMHCFEANFKTIKKASDLGYYFSIPTNIVRSEHFQKMVEDIDINQLLTETDSPFLSPYKDKKNEPAFVVESVKKIAEIKNMDIQEVANNVFMNYQKLF